MIENAILPNVKIVAIVPNQVIAASEYMAYIRRMFHSDPSELFRKKCLKKYENTLTAAVQR